LCRGGKNEPNSDHSRFQLKDLHVCEGDLWLELDLDSWFTESSTTIPWYYKPLVQDTESETKFTLRISWPASVSRDVHYRL
jgi:hypothetical protein